MILQLDPPLPLWTNKGTGVAHFLIDYGLEFDLMWVVFLDDTGQCWSLRNTDVRAMPNISYGATRPEGKGCVSCSLG